MWGTRAQGVTLAGLAVSASLIAGMALAQDPPNPFAGECNRTATPEEVDGARGAHQAAKQFYERAEYARAIQYWRDVFNFDCNAVGTLLNLANAYEKLGDRKNAIYALEEYNLRVKRADPTVDVSKIEQRIKNLKALQQAQASESASAAASAAAIPSASAPPPPPSATTPPIMVKPYGVAPWVTVGAGAVVLIAGGIMVPVGLGNVSDAQRNCKEISPGKWNCPSQTDVDTAQQGKNLVAVGKFALAAGGAAIAAGLAWEFIQNNPKPAPATTSKDGSSFRVRVSPAIGSGMTGATVHGTF